MKYLRIFEKESDYTQYIVGGDDYVTPHVALVRDTNVVKYQIYEPDYTNDYLTIEALEDDLTVSFSLNTIQYSIDNCQTWNELPADTTTPAINTGDKISFKATGLVPDSSNGIGIFTITKKCNLSGNCNSMLFGDKADEHYDLTGYDNVFYGLFYGCSNIIDASQLRLPATTLSVSCYNYMFGNCGSLVTAPELPATELAENCYSYMFQNCNKLNYIKALFTPILEMDSILSAYTNNWVNGVSPTGTFVKNADATWDVTGPNGIPEGWTVETVTA